MAKIRLLILYCDVTYAGHLLSRIHDSALFSCPLWTTSQSGKRNSLSSNGQKHADTHQRHKTESLEMWGYKGTLFIIIARITLDMLTQSAPCWFEPDCPLILILTMLPLKDCSRRQCCHEYSSHQIQTRYDTVRENNWNQSCGYVKSILLRQRIKDGWGGFSVRSWVGRDGCCVQVLPLHLHKCNNCQVSKKKCTAFDPHASKLITMDSVNSASKLEKWGQDACLGL